MNLEISMDAESFLANLPTIGNIGGLSDISKNKENLVLPGRIMKMVSSINYTVCHIHEVYQRYEETVRVQFKVLFHREAAKVLTKKLCEKDYLAILKPRPFRGYFYGEGSSQELHGEVFLVGFSNSNTCDDVYYKRKTMNHWALLTATDTAETNDEIIEVIEEQADDTQQQSNKTISPALRVRSVQEMNFETSNSACTSDDASFLDPNEIVVVHPNETKSPKQSTNVKPNNAMETYFHSGSSLGRAFLNNNTDVAKRMVTMKALNYEVVQLIDVRLNMLAAMCGIITRKVKGPFKLKNGRFRTSIMIQDESVTEEFPVHIYYSNEANEPTINQYDILWLTKMKIKNTIVPSKLRLTGHVYDSNCVITFSRENPEMIYKQSKSIVCTDKQKRRVQELRMWMFQHIPTSRLFTAISDIKLQDASINLCGTIVEKKSYDNTTTVIIRFHDGTSIGIPAVCYDLNRERWIAENNLVRQPPAEEVDICVIDPEYRLCRQLEQLEVGSTVELHNVRTALVHKRIKTVSEYVAKIFVKGDFGNVKIIKQVDLDNSIDKWADDQILSEHDDYEENEEENEETSHSLKKNNINYKRKLFNVDSPIAHSTGATVSPEKHGVAKKQRISSDKTASPCTQSKTTDAKVGGASKALSRNNRTIDQTTTNVEMSCIGSNNSDMVTIAQVHACEVEIAPTETINRTMVAATDNQDDTPSKVTSTKEIRPCRILITRIDDLGNLEENPCAVQKSAVGVSRQNSTVNGGSDNSLSSSDDDQMSDSISSTQTNSESPTIQTVFKANQHTWKSIREKMDKRIEEKNNERAKFDYCKQWPLHKKKEFYIRVCVTSSIPPINDTSTDVDIMSLIAGHCNSCNRYIPFYYSKWIENGEIVAGHCPKCGKYKPNAATRLDYSIICQLLAIDGAQNRRSVMVCGKNAENFFGCTVDQLCSSAEIKMHVFSFLKSLIGRKDTVLRMRSLDTSDGANKHYEIVS